MDEEQQFLFDVNGYIVLEDVSRQRSFGRRQRAVRTRRRADVLRLLRSRSVPRAVPRAPLLQATAGLRLLPR